MRFVAGLCALALMAGCSDGETQAPPSTAAAGGAPAATAGTAEGIIDTADTQAGAGVAVFSWDEGDLGEWVTGDEMTAALADLATRFEGRDLASAVVLDHPQGAEDWTWTFRLEGDTETWTVIAHDGDHGKDEAAELTATDSRLPPGVAFEAATGFAHGFYVLSGPISDESICMMISPPGTSWGYPGESEVRAHEDRVFALGSMMLQEMGWAD